MLACMCVWLRGPKLDMFSTVSFLGRPSAPTTCRGRMTIVRAHTPDITCELPRPPPDRQHKPCKSTSSKAPSARATTSVRRATAQMHDGRAEMPIPGCRSSLAACRQMPTNCVVNHVALIAARFTGQPATAKDDHRGCASEPPRQGALSAPPGHNRSRNPASGSKATRRSSATSARRRTPNSPNARGPPSHRPELSLFTSVLDPWAGPPYRRGRGNTATGRHASIQKREKERKEGARQKPPMGGRKAKGERSRKR